MCAPVLDIILKSLFSKKVAKNINPFSLLPWNFFMTVVVCMFVSVTSYRCVMGNTAWKVSKYGDLFGPYFPAFGLNTKRSLLQMWEKMDQKKLHIWTLSTQCNFFQRISQVQVGEPQVELGTQIPLGDERYHYFLLSKPAQTFM